MPPTNTREPGPHPMHPRADAGPHAPRKATAVPRPNPRPPGGYLTGPGVYLPARICAALERLADLPRIRVQHRGTDPELDTVLGDIRTAAAKWRATATGSPHPPPPEADASSGWLSTTRAAEILGVTDRAIRLAITEHRLHAQQVDGRWRITREDLEHFRASRTP